MVESLAEFADLHLSVGSPDARPEMARDVAVDDRTAGAYENVSDRFHGKSSRPITARGSHSRGN